MKIFLSWSGETSHKMALILRDWLPLVLPYVTPYVSSEDIEKGSKWLSNIMQELETTYYGLLCVTNDNFNAPWLVFEAGALTKAVERSKVTPFLFNIKPTDFSGPLTQFQATTYQENDIRKLILSINRSASEKEQISEDRVERIFKKWWTELNDQLKHLFDSIVVQESTKKKISNTERMLEEILSITRNNEKIIQSPEALFPQEYFEYIISLKNDNHSKLNYEVCDAIDNIERCYYDIKKTIRSTKGLPSRSKEEILLKLTDFNKYIDLLVTEAEKWKKSENN